MKYTKNWWPFPFSSLFWAFTALISCDTFALVQPCCLPFLHTSTIWLQILVFSVNIILLQITSIVFKRCHLFTICIGLFTITCNKYKLCSRIILGLKKVLDVWQFVHLQMEDYKHISMTWGGRGREMRMTCSVYYSTLWKAWKKYMHSSITLVASFGWKAVMTVVHGKGSVSINLVFKTMPVQTDYLGSNPGYVTC